ncbi:MAG TPA: UDP-3-O-acyl-N-acetylglucosamine deacetylase, partial [Rhodopila sp.]|nr:UDP-3-O-acyl-N-acetylglucosamine deacetylase [Rhodopila sp.]
MEGVSRLLLGETAAVAWRQRTLKAAIDCTGVGVHSGRQIHLVIRPAGIEHGIVFRRTDLGQDIAARFDNVVDTRLCTVLASGSARVGTVEHLMAALSALGIDNALIEVDGPEVPILDGSAAPFLFLLDCAGTVEQDAPRHVIEVRRTVRVTAGEAWAELRPLAPIARAGRPILDMDLSIDFPAAAIGRQAASLCLMPDTFRHQVAAARTFAQMHEVAQLQA